MPTLNETIDDLAGTVVARKQSLDDALFALQSWLDHNAQFITEADRDEFGETLEAEKEPQVRDGQPYGDDRSLVASVLRLHAMRLLYRLEEQRRGPIPVDEEDDSPYARARHRLQVALRETELAINEARVDTAIANAHHILADRGANRRWLQDALTRLQTVAPKNLMEIAREIPEPELSLSFLQKITLRVLGIRREELIRRNMQSLHKLAQLQHDQLIEMATLLADSFQAIDDGPGTQQARALLASLEDTSVGG